MKCIILFGLLVAVVSALPFETDEYIEEGSQEEPQYTIVEDEDGDLHYMVPLDRAKRQTTWGLSNKPLTGTINHQGTIFQNPNHHVTGGAYASKDFTQKGWKPEAVGGRVDYLHKPSQSNFGVSADHQRGYGTDLKAQGQYNFIHKKDASVGIGGQYGQHFGGPGGHRKPDYGVFLGGKVNFR